jgi:hypothetical protein
MVPKGKSFYPGLRFYEKNSENAFFPRKWFHQKVLLMSFPIRKPHKCVF